MTAVDGLRAIALADIKLSTTGSQAERRKHFDKAAIAELAGSIKLHGILVPVIARPVNGHFELVAGERRYIAAKTAGVKTINADVRTLTDEQVLEIQLIENLQREGLHELAEAEGYEGLHKLGHSAEEIADKVGKSKAYVYARMKLIALCSKARKAFYEGRINASIALLLARIPVDELQIKALEDLLDHDDNYSSPMSFREAQQLIQAEYTCRLDDAGFKTEDETLLPAAGACGKCPKRTGNHPELFDDIKRGDVCTDPVCFRAKRDAAAARLAADGARVIQGKQAEKIISGDRVLYGADFVELTERPREDPKNRTAAQLLGKDYEPTLVQDPESGKVFKLAKKSDLATALKDAGVKREPASNPMAAEDRKRKLERRFRAAVYAEMRDKLPTKLGPEDVRTIALRFYQEMTNDNQKIVVGLWQLEAVKSKNGYGQDWEKPIVGMLAEAEDAQVARFLFDCVFARDLVVYNFSGNKPTMLLNTAKKLKVNADKIRAELVAAAKPKAKQKAKGKKK